jgi:hypothetical protein
MPYSNSAAAVEALAAEIGDNVYMDIAKWHLYLREAHFHTLLAEQLYPLLSDGVPSQERINQMLTAMTVKLGGGKRELPLIDLIPQTAQQQLMQVLQDFYNKM